MGLVNVYADENNAVGSKMVCREHCDCSMQLRQQMQPQPPSFHTEAWHSIANGQWGR